MEAAAPAAAVVVDNEAAVLGRAGGAPLDRPVEMDSLIARLTDPAAACKPVVVLAASGAGKSTFLAGLG